MRQHGGELGLRLLDRFLWQSKSVCNIEYLLQLRGIEATPLYCVHHFLTFLVADDSLVMIGHSWRFIKKAHGF
jgi:hypothetical protein